MTHTQTRHRHTHKHICTHQTHTQAHTHAHVHMNYIGENEKKKHNCIHIILIVIVTWRKKNKIREKFLTGCRIGILSSIWTSVRDVTELMLTTTYTKSHRTVVDINYYSVVYYYRTIIFTFFLQKLNIKIIFPSSFFFVKLFKYSPTKYDIIRLSMIFVW